MRTIIYITGGQRSGKSRFAQGLAESFSADPVYLATARVWDDEFEKRIQRHRNDRGNRWETIEEEKYISKHKLTGKTVLLDCTTLWLNNFFFDNNYDAEAALKQASSEWEKFIDQDFTLIVVGNELGMGLIPADAASRSFLDLQGWLNRQVAAAADSVYLMISGIQVKIK